MTAPEREALVKALRFFRQCLTDELDDTSADLVDQAANMIEAQHRHIEMHAGDTLSLDGEIQLLREEIETLKSSPAVTVTEGWKPIETAPKDGDEPLLLAFHDGDGRLEVYIGRYCGALGIWCDDNCGDAYLATHWQPLPPPPSTTPQTGSQE